MKSYTEKYSQLHYYIYLYALLLIAVGLPFSEILLSFGQFILIINWLWEGRFQEKWNRIISNKALLVFLLLYSVHLVWLFNTENLAYAFRDFKIKLPLLLLPVLIGSSGAINKKDIDKIMYYFIASVILASIVVFIISLGVFDVDIDNTRKISIFISHIRFSLMINIALFTLSVILIRIWSNIKVYYRILILICIFWLIFFLFVLQSITGIFVFVVLAPLFLLKYILEIKKFILKWFFLILLITISLISISFVSHSINRFYTVDKVDFSNLPEKTSQGNFYDKFGGDKTMENGHYTWINVCRKELKDWWDKNSKIPYDSLDNKGQRIKYVLIRYLSSKGFTKDYSGCQNLTKSDINNIENGCTNYLLENKYSIYGILYKILWQIDVYLKTGDSNNHSIVQRIEYFKTGTNVLSRNFWFGVGTGDVQDEFDIDYQLIDSKLSVFNRHRAHNQFLTFLISFGFIGFVIVILSILYPIINTWNNKNTIFIIFIIILLLSFLNEDTLETQTGVTLFTFFYCVFLFVPKNNSYGER